MHLILRFIKFQIYFGSFVVVVVVIGNFCLSYERTFATTIHWYHPSVQSVSNFIKGSVYICIFIG